jgi:IS30 family transposase
MVQEIEDKLNNRPRKILGYKTAMEVMMMHQNMH